MVRLVPGNATGDREVTCLGYDDRCVPADDPCPVTGETSLEMGRRFALTDIGPTRLLSTRLYCGWCQAVTHKLLLAPTHVFCTECQAPMTRSYPPA
jgi:hypothetical protein